MANICNSDNLKAFPLRSGMRQGQPTSFSPLETVANAEKPEKETKDIHI